MEQVDRSPARTPEVGSGPRVLVVTNDFPPRVGGVQQYVWNLVRNLPPDRVAVLAPNWPGWREHDAAEPYPIHRWPATSMWPTPELARRARSLIREHDADIVLFGHGLLPAMGGDLTRHGVPYVALTHGWEVWLARTPGVASLMRRGLQGARAVTAISRYTDRAIRGPLGLSRPFELLYPGVDPQRFSPTVDGSAVRRRLRLDDRKVVLCVSRLVPRKGQDTLIRGMSLVHRLAPGTVLVIAGHGPYRPALEDLAAQAPAGSVVFAGQVDSEDLPSFYAAGDVFAMPCRSRWGGLEVEGFGIVFLEAGATRKPVVAGRSGGADEAVADQQTGLLVEGAEPKATALAVAKLLTYPELAGRLADAGRARVEGGFTWAGQTAKLMALLERAAS